MSTIRSDPGVMRTVARAHCWLGLAVAICAAQACRADDGTPGAAARAAADHFDIAEFRVLGNTTLPERQVEAAVYGFLGEDRTIADVEQARDALVAAYRAAGRGTVLVDIPEQAVEEGIVRLQVTEGRIEKVHIKGARYYSERRILARLAAVSPGVVPDLPALQAELTVLAGESRDRQITPVLKPGATPGTVAVDFGVDDHLPLHATLEANNRSTADTTPTRLIGTLSYENMFQRAETLSLQYQTAPERPSEVKVGALSYLGRMASPDWTWSAYLIRSNSDVAAIGTLAVIGDGWIAGGRFTRSFGLTETGAQNVSFGADYKSFGENIRLPADVSASTPIHYLLWTAQYGFARQRGPLELQGQLGLSFGLRGLGATDAEFEFKRAGGQSSFAYLRANSSATWHLWRGWALAGRLGLQYTAQPLVSNEQLSLGGVDTVRGFLDAEALVDSGAAAALEFRAPPFRAGRLTATGFLFYDRGLGMVEQPLVSEIRSGTVRTDLISWGIGSHFNLAQNVDAALDWAKPKRHGTRTDSGDSRVDFSVKLTF